VEIMLVECDIHTSQCVLLPMGHSVFRSPSRNDCPQEPVGMAVIEQCTVAEERHLRLSFLGRAKDQNNDTSTPDDESLVRFGLNQ
jgi:hypothetical protein